MIFYQVTYIKKNKEYEIQIINFNRKKKKCDVKFKKKDMVNIKKNKIRM